MHFKEIGLSRTRLENGRLDLWDNPSTLVAPLVCDAVGIQIKIAKRSGVHEDILRERAFSSSNSQRKRVKEAASNESSLTPDISPSNEDGKSKTSANKELLCASLKQIFPSMFHAFAYFDVDRRGTITERELTNGIKKLEVEALSNLRGSDLKILVEELGQKRGQNGLGLSMSAFARYFYFGDDLTDWKEKLSQARHNRSRRRSSEIISPFSELVHKKEEGRQSDDRCSIAPFEFEAEVRTALTKDFGGPAGAFAFVDAWHKGSVPTAHISVLIARSLEKHPEHAHPDANAALQSWLRAREDAGNISAQAFLSSLSDQPADDVVESLVRARRTLADKVALESRAQAAAVTEGSQEWADTNPVRSEIARRLRDTFASVADAFFCMASDSDAALTAPDLSAGLARAGLDPRAARAALAEAGLPTLPDDPTIPAVLALEFCAAFTWHELSDWGLVPDAQPQPPLLPPAEEEWAARDEGFFADPGKLCPELGRALSSTRLGGAALSNPTLLRPARPWKEELLQRAASAIRVPRARLDVVGAAGGVLTLVVYPDPDGRMPSEAVARDLMGLLAGPEGALALWDPDVFQGCQSSLLLPATTGWRRDTASPLALRSSSALGSPATTRVRSGLWPRSRPGFSSLGAQEQWESLDCEVAVAVVASESGASVPRSQRQVSRKERYPCTILRHKNGIEIELVHHSFGNFTFREGGPSRRPIRCSCEGLMLDCQPTEFTVLPKLTRGKQASGPGTGAAQASNAVSSSGESGAKLCQEAVCEEGNNTSDSSAQVNQIADDFTFARYCSMQSRPMGRWSSYLDVPNILILNECDPNIQLVLTPTGFVFMGSGQRGKALIVEHSKPPFQLTLAAARKLLRQVPTMPNDKTELDLCQSSFQQLTFEQIQKEFELENDRQDARYRMLLDEAFPEHCLCTERLLELVAIENGLSVHDKVNRRALSIRLVGEGGQACIPGTGSSTELAVLNSRLHRIVREKIRSDVVVASFFRCQGHSSVQVVSNLVQQLHKYLPAPCPECPIFSSTSSYEELAEGLQQVMLKLILLNKAVVIVLDQAHLAEQRVLGKVMSFLRTELQPWLYSIRNPGFVRVVFSGESGFCFPSGIPIATVQLNGLKKESAEIILQKKLSAENKYIARKYIQVVCQKEEAWRWQYLNIIVEVLKQFWVFEQQTDLCDSLPGTLVLLYALILQRLELNYGHDAIRSILESLVAKRSISVFDLRQHVEESKQSACIIDIGKILRHPPPYAKFELHDWDLEQAIRSRYDDSFEGKKRNEVKNCVQQDRLLEEMALTASAFVLEHKITRKTPCMSLEAAISLAAAGDTIILCKKDYTLSKSLLIDRDLTIVTDEGISASRILINQGRPAFFLEATKRDHSRAEATESLSDLMIPDKTSVGFVVSIRGVAVFQTGFEAEETPRCVHVGNSAKLILSDSSITSDQGIGIVVGKGGTLVMTNSCCKHCAIHSILVQRSGCAELQSSELISNSYHEVADNEKSLHELFVRFCKGTSSLSKRDAGRVSIQQKLLMENQMGQRAETLDLNEFMALLTEISIFPSLMTKTDVADSFGLSVSSSQERELDWGGFKNSLYHICNTHALSEISGVKVTESFKFPSNLVESKKDHITKWCYSDGLIVDGQGSSVHMIDSYVCGSINGCLVRGGGTLRLSGCRISRSGKSRLDAAGVMVSGNHSKAELSDCTISMSENNGLVVRYGAVCKISTSTIHNTGRQALLAMGRGSKVDMTECSITEAYGCGILAGKEAVVLVSNSHILSCSDTGVLARFLGTKVVLKTCWIDGNVRGISAENEATIYVEGAENIKDSLEASRKGILEYLKPNGNAGTSSVPGPSSPPTDHVMFENPMNISILDTDRKETSSSVKVLKERPTRKPELNKMKSLLSSLFQNVAEASIVLDTNAGGTISKSEIERFCSRLGISVNMKVLFDELELTEKSMEEMTVHDFMRWFCWHDRDIFIDGTWKWLLVEAKRSRRRIMNRLYERLKQERPSSAAGGRKSLDHRLTVRFKHHSVSLRESISRTAVDKTESSSLVFVKAGLLYSSSKDAMASKNAVTKHASSHGLPGVYKCFDQEKISAKYLEMNTCTLSRYPRLNKSRDELGAALKIPN